MEQGDRFGRWTVTGRNVGKKIEAVCDCGTERIVSRTNLSSGLSTSCGCKVRETRAMGYKHGATRNGKPTREYTVWSTMKARCHNPKSPVYASYGGRGILVCKRWRESFSAFLADMGNRPSDDHSLDRIDPERGYEPNNCRWATRIEQARNKRDTVYVEYHGIRLPLAELCDLKGLDRMSVYIRYSSGVPIDEAIAKGKPV